MDYRYVSIDRIFSKLARDIESDFDEGDIVEWTGEALEFIGASKYYEEAVAFVEVKDHQCLLPTWLHSVLQIARNHNFTGPKGCCPTPAVAAAEVPNVTYQTCGKDGVDMGYVVLDGCGTPVLEYDIAYYRPYFDLRAEFYGWSNCNYYRNNYTPVRLSSHSFFSSLVCDTQGQPTSKSGLYRNSTAIDEYQIIQGKILRFSFRTGSVAIAYNRQVRDTVTGYPMIPDNISYTTAIIKYLTMMMSQRSFYAGREGAKGKLDKAEADWHWYCKQASNVDMMPYGVDEYQNLLDQRSNLIPQQDRYFGYFGNLSNHAGNMFTNNAVPGTEGRTRVAGSGENDITVNNTNEIVNNYGDFDLVENDW